MISELFSLTLELDPEETETWSPHLGASDFIEASDLHVAFGLMTQLQSLKLVVRGDLDLFSPLVRSDCKRLVNTEQHR